MNNTKTKVIKVHGKNIDNFFQNIITNDIKNLNKSPILYTAILSPQGKYLHDFIILQEKNYFFLETNLNSVAPLIKELKKYDLRNEIVFELQNNIISKVVVTEKLSKEFLKTTKGSNYYFNNDYKFFLDPRAKNFLYRFWFEKSYSNYKNLNFSDIEEVEIKRILMKIPNSYSDLISNKSFILNYNFENINALSFAKGCYIGQENTARQKYRGNIKYSLQAAKIIKGLAPRLNEDIYCKEKKIATMKSQMNNLCLLLIRNDLTKEKNLKITTDLGVKLEIL